jgi:hypothetical protein
VSKILFDTAWFMQAMKSNHTGTPPPPSAQNLTDDPGTNLLTDDSGTNQLTSM